MKSNEEKFREEAWRMLKENQKGFEELREAHKEYRKESEKGFEELRQQQKENQKGFKEYQKENEKGFEELREAQKENQRGFKELREAQKKTDRIFNSQWGKLIESLVEGNLVELFKECNIPVKKTSTRNEVLFDNKEYEFDIFAVNSSCIVVVEVKTELTSKKVAYFIEKMKDFKKMYPEYRDKSVYGAVAYIKSDKSCNRYAHRQGLFIIRATGNSSSIVNPKGFVPREFGEEQEIK